MHASSLALPSPFVSLVRSSLAVLVLLVACDDAAAPSAPKADAPVVAGAGPTEEAKAAEGKIVPAAEGEVKAEPEGEVKAGPEAEGETKAEGEVKAEGEPTPDVEPEVKAEPKPEVKAEPKPEVKAEPKPEVKAEPKPEVKAEPKPDLSPAAVDGRAIYLKKCKSCHGTTGAADTSVGEKEHIDSWKEPGWKSKWTLAKVKAIVEDGKPGTKMKAFKGKLTPEEIDAVSKYAHSLGS